MKIINTPEEFKAMYYYKSPPNPEPCPKLDAYPKMYPCIVEQRDGGGGLMGEYVYYEFTYLPKNKLHAKLFIEGYKKGRDV